MTVTRKSLRLQFLFKIIKHFVLAKGLKPRKTVCKKDAKDNSLKIELKIDFMDKKILLPSTSGERNLNSTPESLSKNIQQKETQLLVFWVNYRRRRG